MFTSINGLNGRVKAFLYSLDLSWYLYIRVSFILKEGLAFPMDCLCGLVVRVLGYRSGGPGSIPGTNKKKVVGLQRGPLSLVSTTEELHDRKVAAPV
jgi:hypothetical protein